MRNAWQKKGEENFLCRLQLIQKAADHFIGVSAGAEDRCRPLELNPLSDFAYLKQQRPHDRHRMVELQENR